jgi:Tfp pilus assembly protein PilX
MVNQSLKTQNGSVLLFSLIVLTVITLTAVVGMQRSTLQLRMLNSMQHHQEVYNATNEQVERGVSFLRSNVSRARRIMGPLIQTPGASSSGTLLVNEAAWEPIVLHSSVFQITESLDLSNQSASAIATTPFFLRGSGNRGSSNGGVQTYDFTYVATGTDRSGRISSSQEIGLQIMGPSI